jgi:Ca-activated chloride channel family protein
LTTSGQTNMYPAIERAYLALEQADADQKHVILLTDGISLPGDFDLLAAKMFKSGITMSTVSISPEADKTILSDIARIAGGTFHPCDNPEDVENILVRETLSVTKKTEPKALAATVLRALPGLPRLSSKVKEYGATSPKSGTELLLMTGTGDPLLAWWRYGAGMTIAVTTDLTKAASAPFWQRVVRHAQPSATPTQGRLVAKLQNGVLTAWLDAFQEDGRFLTDGVVTLQISHNGKPLEIPAAQQVVEGRWQVEHSAPETGEYRVTATAQQDSTVIFDDQIAIWNDYPEELVLQETNEAILREAARLGGGNYDPAPADYFAAEDRSVSRVTPLWPRLVMLAILLLMADVSIRRAEFALLMGKKR